VQALGLREAILDGEVAAVLPSGTTSFQALQNALAGTGADLAYFVFDLLHLEGHDLRRARLEDRKALLREVVTATAADGIVRYSDHVAGGGQAVFDSACRLGLEGIISKRRDAPYSGGRGRSWLKVKCLRRQEFVIGGYTDPEGARVGVGALLLGVRDPTSGELTFAGKVGTGFTQKTLKDLERRLVPLQRPTSPFGKARIPGVTRAHWVEPRLVAEVAFTEWTSDGRLRHPSFQGLREDKSPDEVVREEPAATGAVAAAAAKRAPARRPHRSRSREGEALHKKAGVRGKAAPVELAGVKISNPDRVIFSEIGFTKLDLARYYLSIADRILPHVEGRPLTLVRCPEGADEPCFYMKHSGVWAPPALRRVKIREKTKVGEYLVVEDEAGLMALAQMGILEIHPWGATADHLEHPDRVVFDLDPDPTVEWREVVAGARLLRSRLGDIGFESFVKTTGGKGLHVVVPLRRAAGWGRRASSRASWPSRSRRTTRTATRRPCRRRSASAASSWTTTGTRGGTRRWPRSPRGPGRAAPWPSPSRGRS
jgi:bifunctional non-homologous end joining protein LigD